MPKSAFPAPRTLQAKPAPRDVSYTRPSVEQSWRGEAADPVTLFVEDAELTAAEEAVYRYEIW